MAVNGNAQRHRGSIYGARTVGRVDGASPTGAPAGTATTIRWNSADKAPNATLSNSDRTLTSSSGTSGARSTLSWASSSKIYIPLTIDAIVGSITVAFGLATSATSLTAADSGGSYVQNHADAQISGQSIMWVPRAASTITVPSTYGVIASNIGWRVFSPAGSNFGIAADFAAGKGWFQLPGGGFMGDPANGLDPVFTWTPGSLTLFLWGLTTTTGQISIPATTIYAAPAGFAVA